MSAEPPVLPDAEEARRWAAEELAKPEYREAAPSWAQTFWENFLDWLSSLDGSTGSPGQLPASVIGIAVVLVIAVAVVLARPRLNAAARRPGDVFEPGTSLAAADYRQRAEAAAAAGKWGDAVVERFRALVASAEERVILDPQPGRTADEAARGLSAPFPFAAARLERAAGTFDAVRYGNRAASRGDYQEVAGLDAALDAARPGQAAAGHDAAVRP
ncbi:DUF4129 domain-containing protein [Pseudarthrobacter sp. NamE2]|uniref:DUF4129 domain-containing protein n=1 Tax=Pseudarthrobacter sp. NamE2 TaxID=2576838 RepID=UPI0010FD0300|nr:DUF4129 domain-containing protein [Pseudarthrobacter sp. NamE2]TLM85626.1 DUF4129 domain-containing protein [Pseudarthrobacter sp. NamE2]